MVLRARLAFGEDRVESLVDDEAADLYVDQMCGQIGVLPQFRDLQPQGAGAGVEVASPVAPLRRFVRSGELVP